MSQRPAAFFRPPGNHQVFAHSINPLGQTVGSDNGNRPRKPIRAITAGTWVIKAQASRPAILTTVFLVMAIHVAGTTKLISKDWVSNILFLLAFGWLLLTLGYFHPDGLL